jgi:hypothetical protein
VKTTKQVDLKRLRVVADVKPPIELLTPSEWSFRVDPSCSARPMEGGLPVAANKIQDVPENRAAATELFVLARRKLSSAR